MPTDIINTLGYVGVFLLIFLFPFPHEVVLPLAGFITAQGKLSPVCVVIAGVMGSMAGSLPWYWAGRYIGEKRLRTWVKRQQLIKVSTKDFQKAKQWFEQDGSKAILLSQFIPGIRTLIALPAGMSKMNLGLFLLYLVFSAIVWQGILVCSGYLLGSRYGLIEQYVRPFLGGVGIVLIIIGTVWIMRRKPGV
jgi:membrane protein DedA with SNARE-associated domain